VLDRGEVADQRFIAPRGTTGEYDGRQQADRDSASFRTRAPAKPAASSANPSANIGTDGSR
jgi:hypothetical protein